jgi:hypothetical protein
VVKGVNIARKDGPQEPPRHGHGKLEQSEKEAGPYRVKRPQAGDDAAEEAGAGKKDKPGNTTEPGGDIRNLWTLLTLSAATSIDALAVGVSFSLLDQGIWLNAAVIGAVTMLICLAGFEFGRRIGRLFEKWAGAAGGLMLIGIGTKILIEHLIAG